MKELSIFIDESGDFGAYTPKSPFYIIGIVFHDQKNDISEATANLDNGLKQIGFTRKCVHVGPLIRREAEYTHLSIQERIRILRRMLNFASRVNFTYQAFIVDKKHIHAKTELVTKLTHQISNFIQQYYEFISPSCRFSLYCDFDRT